MKNAFLVLVALASSVSFSALSPFSLPDMNNNGVAYQSSDHKGSVFVIEAYFLGCPYCNLNAPNVNALAEKFASNSSVQVLDVGVDRKDEDYATWIEKHSPNHPVLKDASRIVVGQLGTTGYPSTYVVDCDGNVVYETSGVWEEGTVEEIESAISGAETGTCGAR